MIWCTFDSEGQVLGEDVNLVADDNDGHGRVRWQLNTFAGIIPHPFTWLDTKSVQIQLLQI